MARYILYNDVDPRRLAIAMGLTGLAMAALNWIVVKLTSTDIWLFYTTFVDVFISMGMVLYGIHWSRNGKRPAPS